MAKTQEQALILLRFGLSFKKLLDENKAEKQFNTDKGIKDHKLVYTLGQLSSTTGLRKATLSNIFSGSSNPEGTTILLILEGINKSLSKFAILYENITQEELLAYSKSIENARRNRKLKKGIIKSKK